MISVDNLLLEHTLSVTQTVAPSRVVQRGHRIKEAGGKTSKTAVTKGSVVFLRDDIFHPKAKIGKTL